MGSRMKPVSVVIICALGLVALIGVCVLAYTWKQGKLHHKKMSSSSSMIVDGEMGQHQHHHDHNHEHDDVQKELIHKCEGRPEWECNIRLSPNVLPLHYDIFLHPDFDTELFSGKVSILINVTEPTDHIRLHTTFLNVSNTTLATTGDNHAELEIKRAFAYVPNEYWIVEPVGKIGVGLYNLSVVFDGSLTRGITGFYRSKYFDSAENVTKSLISTKFQPTYARKAFPCFDEPSFKSTFSVSLVKPSHLTALGNMPVKNEEVNVPREKLTTVHFEKSVPMVTYLVAVAIGEFNYTSSVSKSGIPVRVYAVSFRVKYTEYANSITARILDNYEKYFKIKYPLPKLDVIAIPDFVSGAMENWGLISFRDSNLLWQRGVASAYNKQRIASVISHELAHMWFGNLVTLKWWDSLWINEGFASFIEYKGVDSVHPDWDMPSQFAYDDLTPVLKLDAQQSSHPIVQPVFHPDQITEIFDQISYNKGSSVIRMLENFMGPKNFQQGITTFLNKFAFSNAITEDLWEALQSEAPHDVDISLVMDTWTRQMGYPILTVTSKPKEKVITVRQERFIDNPNRKQLQETSPSKHQVSPFGFKWEIPLLFSTSQGPASTQLVWLRHNETSVNIPVASDLDWVKINTGQFGYFRVKYDAESLGKIEKDYGSKFSPDERCGLLDDVFSLAFSNYTGYDTALRFGLQLTNEKHLVPWKCSGGHLSKLLHLLRSASSETYELYKKYLNELTEIQFRRLQWTDDESDPHLERLLKPTIFSLSCEHGIGSCRDQVRRLFDEWIEQNTQIPSSLRALVYKWGVWQSNETIWNVVWSRYLLETDGAERQNLLRALASSQESWIISRLLDHSKNETLVRRQDYFLLLKFIALSPVGNTVLWNFYRNDYGKLLERFGKNDRYFGSIIKAIVTDYSSEGQLQEMEHLFKQYPDAGAGARARQNSLETVHNNILWTQRSVPVIQSWLKSHFDKSVPNSRHL